MASKRIMISQQITRNLGDRSDDKRKQAALEIEQYIKELGPPTEANHDRINSVISMLLNDFLLSYQPNFRKGGLIGLSAVTIALLDQAGAFINKLLPPVLRCFLDQEARVRYYACEALYNMTKVVRGQILLFFNEVFDGLCKLFADADVDVRSAAQLLDRLVKDVVTECAAFDVERFIPLLRERIRLKSPYVRQLVVGWVTLLDSIPDIDMLEFLPEYLGGLFDMLSDANKDIRQQAYAALSLLLREIVHSPRVDLGSLIPILTAQSGLKDNFRRITVLTWLCEFVHLGKDKVLPFLPELLGSSMQCMGDAAREIRAKAQQCNDALLRLVVDSAVAIDLSAIVATIAAELGSTWLPARLASLRWVAMLLSQHPQQLFEHLHALFPVLLATLQDADDQVVRLALEVIARLGLDVEGRLHPACLDMILTNVLRLFASDVDFLEARGGLVIRQLCLLLDGAAVYVRLAELLATNADVEFTTLMAQTLNLVLLASTELHPLRATLKTALAAPAGGSAASGAESSEGRRVFSVLFAAWSHAPVAALSLALLAQAYELAAAIVEEIARSELTVGVLLQLDRLVQLIESPIYVLLRLHLLDPVAHPAVHRALYGLLVLLPQSAAFTCLKERLQSVAPYTAALGGSLARGNTAVAAAGSGMKAAEVAEHVETYRAVQLKHQVKRRRVAMFASLLAEDDATGGETPETGLDTS